MATGARVRCHLKHNIAREECSVIFVGFAAKGTLARRSSLAKIPVHILGDDIPVRARIHTINGFSAHADQAELLKWHGHTGAGRTFLTHGRKLPCRSSRRDLPKRRSKCPSLSRSSICSRLVQSRRYFVCSRVASIGSFDLFQNSDLSRYDAVSRAWRRS
jgi:metallo-beta-lactamase family protein